MQYIKPHLSPELRAQITPQNKRDRRMLAAGVILFLASIYLSFTFFHKSDDPAAATLNNKLESIGTQTESVTFGSLGKQVLGESTSSDSEASSAITDTTQATTSPDGQFTSYTVKAGDTLFNISQSYGIKWDLIAQFNSLSEPYILHAGQTLRIPQATTSKVPGKIYTIQQGDTLGSIAKEYNVTVNDIIAVNPNLQKSDLISIGQVIKLP